MNRFEQILAGHHLSLTRRSFESLQINVGRKCNQACRHCHVDAAPWRTEMIEETTAHRIGEWIRRHRPPVVDLTGGAPELSPFFRYLVETARASGAWVIDRNNLTILEEPGQEDLAEYLELLANSFNPATVEGLMCRTTLSVDYRGRLHDCDFNQMLDMVWHGERDLFLWDITPSELPGRSIATGAHCLACTAGAGSSCTGALQEQGR